MAAGAPDAGRQPRAREPWHHRRPGDCGATERVGPRTGPARAAQSARARGDRSRLACGPLCRRGHRRGRRRRRPGARAEAGRHRCQRNAPAADARRDRKPAPDARTGGRRSVARGRAAARRRRHDRQPPTPARHRSRPGGRQPRVVANPAARALRHRRTANHAGPPPWRSRQLAAQRRSQRHRDGESARSRKFWRRHRIGGSATRARPGRPHRESPVGHGRLAPGGRHHAGSRPRHRRDRYRDQPSRWRSSAGGSPSGCGRTATPSASAFTRRGPTRRG